MPPWAEEATLDFEPIDPTTFSPSTLIWMESTQLNDSSANATGCVSFLAIQSRVMGCWGVRAETEFVENQPAKVDELKIFVFRDVGDVGAKLAEAEAAMGRSNSQ